MSLIAYKSSAGSGKTFTLVLDYLSIALLDPKKFRNILALTFTLKATAEMKQRLMRYLQLLSQQDKEKDWSPEINAIAAILAEKTKLTLPQIQQRSKQLLNLILHHYSELSIYTLDSFVVKIVKSFAHDLNLSSNFELELDSEVFVEAAVEHLLKKIGKDPVLTQFVVDFVLEALDNENYQSLQNELEKKANLLFQSSHYQPIESLSEVPLSEFELLRKTLNQDLAKTYLFFEQMGKKGLQLMEQGGVQPNDTSSGFLEKFFHKLINVEINSASNLSKIETDTFKKHIDEGLEWYPKKSAKDGALVSAINAIKPEVNQLVDEFRAYQKNHLPLEISKALIAKNLSTSALLNELKKGMHQFSMDNDLLHLSELNRKIADVVNQQPAPFIYERLGQRFHHFLVDEFQDTSTLQWINLLPLLHNGLSEGYKSLLVGDPKQSIYRWRDGDVDQFVALPKLLHHDVNGINKEREKLLESVFSEKVLNTNYRSQRNIIEFNNLFFNEYLNQQSPYLQNIYKEVTQIASKNEYTGRVEVDYFTKNQEDEDILNLILEKINRLHGDYRYNEICILGRKNSYLSEIANFLLAHNIPVMSSEALQLTYSKEVNTLLAWMQLLHLIEPQINAYIIHRNLFQKDYVPKVQLTLKTLMELSHARGVKIIPNQLILLNAYDLLQFLIESFYAEQDLNPYLLRLLDLALELNKKGKSSVRDFLDFWEKRGKKVSIQVSETQDAVILNTVHKSKGLEFPVVIFPIAKMKTGSNRGNLFWKECPSTLPGNIPQVLLQYLQVGELSSFAEAFVQEKQWSDLDILNLLYVAFTRPTEQLHLLVKKDEVKTLWESLQKIEWPSQLQPVIDNQRITLGSDPNPRAKTKAETKKNEVALKNLSSSHPRPLRLKIEDSTDTRRQQGMEWHEVLSQFYLNQNHEIQLQNLTLRFNLQEEEVQQYHKWMQQLESNPRFLPFFDSQFLHFNERVLVSGSGQVFRPDKVVFTPTEIWVIDYKRSDYELLSPMETEKHQKQVHQYLQLISEMHSQPVKAFLLYFGKEIELVEVG